MVYDARVLHRSIIGKGLVSTQDGVNITMISDFIQSDAYGEHNIEISSKTLYNLIYNCVSSCCHHHLMCELLQEYQYTNYIYIHYKMHKSSTELLCY